MVSVPAGVKSLVHAEQRTPSFGSTGFALSGVAEPSPPWHACFFVKAQITESLCCVTLLPGTSADTCSLCPQGRAVSPASPASYWGKTSGAAGVPEPGI